LTLTYDEPPGARADAWCLLIHADASLSMLCISMTNHFQRYLAIPTCATNTSGAAARSSTSFQADQIKGIQSRYIPGKRRTSNTRRTRRTKNRGRVTLHIVSRPDPSVTLLSDPFPSLPCCALPIPCLHFPFEPFPSLPFLSRSFSRPFPCLPLSEQPTRTQEHDLPSV
jgi:hypothetical protein